MSALSLNVKNLPNSRPPTAINDRIHTYTRLRTKHQ